MPFERTRLVPSAHGERIADGLELVPDNGRMMLVVDFSTEFKNPLLTLIRISGPSRGTCL